jgi:hypothetical protein
MSDFDEFPKKSLQNVSLSFSVAICPQITTRETSNEFSWNLILGVLLKFVDILQTWLKSDKNKEHFPWMLTLFLRVIC